MRKVNDYLIEPGFLPIPFCYSSLSSFHGARAEHGLEFCFLLPSQGIYILYHDSMVLALCMEPGYIVPSISTLETSHPQHRKHIMHPFTLSHKVIQATRNYLERKTPSKKRAQTADTLPVFFTRNLSCSSWLFFKSTPTTKIPKLSKLSPNRK